jgi:DNA-binding NarL/FixJ family response regulator
MRRRTPQGIMRPVDRTILIVDDHAAFRRSARALLQAEGLDVVGEAADGATAITEVERLQPAIVLLDIQLPDTDGFAVAATLADRADPPGVILISSRDAIEYGDRIAAANTLGFIVKSRLSGAAIAALLE